MSSNSQQHRRVTAEEKERFIALLLPLRHRLAHFARAMVPDPEEARDLVSDTILAALEGFHRLKHPEAFLSFLFTITTRLQRRRAERNRVFQRYEESNLLHPDSSIAPDTAADIQRLYAAMDQLPAAQREAVALFEISGLRLEEICTIQNCSLSAVKMRLKRGREQLGVLLGAKKEKEWL
ncbi:MAG: RNA polymerase sigma factor [Chlorobi bacterium]|nr:RNA polymerase sigma factor [Chlorobiota bacterium]